MDRKVVFISYSHDSPEHQERVRLDGLEVRLDQSLNGSRRIGEIRLPPMPAKLFGREKELKRLDAAWADPAVHVVTLVAWGGEGKSALAGKWAARLAARGYDEARYFEWSFYSQGSGEDRMASSDPFLAAALRFFGDGPMADSPAAPEEKGRRLADLIAQERTLLLLDGVEPLQYPPGPLGPLGPLGPRGGTFKDPGIKALLRRLAQTHRGLCLVTTRESLTDLAGFRETTAPEWKLESLSKKAGLALLKSLGVHGHPKDLGTLVEEVDGHALTLNLLGSYLAKAHGGDVRRRDRVQFQEADRKTQGGHAFRTMAAYESWLAEGVEEGVRQLAILRLMGLFDRPATAKCLAALRQAPAIPGLTEPLVGLSEEDWNLACSALRDAHLLAPAATGTGRGGVGTEGETLDAHPLLRQYFAQRLREEKPEAWRAAHGRLYENLRDTTEHQPDTLEGLQPLYQAVTHGCLAGRQQETCEKVYRDRILRGRAAFSTKQLGAIGADLGAVASFFEPPWSRVSPALTEGDQAWLLNEAAFSLRALGRLTEAREPMRAGLEMRIRQEVWKSAAIIASNLSELELTLGEVPAAVRNAEQSVTFADRSGDEFQRVSKRATQADALHQVGLRTEALELFREAERMQAERLPEYPLLSSLSGFRYCDLLLAEAERAAWRGRTEGADLAAQAITAKEVEGRAERTIAIAEGNRRLLDIALAHLTLGRARLNRSILEGADPTAASSEIEQVVAGLRRAGTQHMLPFGLLTRAWLRAVQGDPTGARADLDEAQEIAERGPMPLFLADIALYRARLFRDCEALAVARGLIEKHGYWRRKEELEDAELAANGWAPPPRPARPRKPKSPRPSAAKPLPETAMSADQERWPAPTNPDAFESLCLDLWREIWQDPGAQKNGRSGQPQAGVDIVGTRQGRSVGVQCKQKDGLMRSSLTVRELETEVQKALLFKPSLAEFTVATSGPRDAKVQERARALTEEHRAKGLFSVHVWSWEDIWHELYGRRPLLARLLPLYWPGTSAAAQAPRAAATDSKGALSLWQEKLAFLLEQEPTTFDHDAKFALMKRIAEAREKIRGYGDNA